MNYKESREEYKKELDKLNEEYRVKKQDLKRKYLEYLDENEYKGTVIWFNHEKGYGFCRGENGEDVFIHFSEIKMDDFKNLDEGDSISFNIYHGERGAIAKNIKKIIA